MTRTHSTILALVFVLGMLVFALRIRPAELQAQAHLAAPGAINPAVSQANIHQTICRYGWTKSIRPPVRYTSHLKREQMNALGLPGRMSDYEEDHMIPLEIGGAPYDENNLWPEPISDAKRKDRLENKLNRAVCDGRMSLRDAQAEIVVGPY